MSPGNLKHLLALPPYFPHPSCQLGEDIHPPDEGDFWRESN